MNPSEDTSTEASVSNVDQAEIQKFEALAHRWWDPEGDFRPLHDINPARLGFILDHADLLAGEVVDVGCGGGILTESMARTGARSPPRRRVSRAASCRCTTNVRPRVACVMTPTMARRRAVSAWRTTS